MDTEVFVLKSSGQRQPLLLSLMLLGLCWKGRCPGAGRQGLFCVFKDVDRRIEKGEFVTLIGYSGCGKSALLNIIAGFEQASTGGVILDGKEVTSPGLDCMVVLQRFALVPLTHGVTQEELVRMWSATRHTVRMVTHNVDEAILLSDRIALMTNSPEARLAESFAVNLPRPRTREAMIDTDEYTRLRSHMLHFLMRGSHALATPDA